MKKTLLVLFCLGSSAVLAQAPKVATRVEVKVVAADGTRGNEIQREVREALSRLGLELVEGQTVVTWRGNEQTAVEVSSVWQEGGK
jgi:hypothetical protein